MPVGLVKICCRYYSDLGIQPEPTSHILLRLTQPPDSNNGYWYSCIHIISGDLFSCWRCLEFVLSIVRGCSGNCSCRLLNTVGVKVPGLPGLASGRLTHLGWTLVNPLDAGHCCSLGRSMSAIHPGHMHHWYSFQANPFGLRSRLEAHQLGHHHFSWIWKRIIIQLEASCGRPFYTYNILAASS